MAGHARSMTTRKPKNTKKTLRRLFSYFEQSKLKLILIVALVLVSAGAAVAGTYLLKPIINEGIVPLIGTNPGLQNFYPLLRMLLMLGIVYGIGVVCTLIYARLNINLSRDVLNSIRLELFNKMQSLPISYFDTHTHGELMSRFTNDVDSLRELLSNGITQFTSSIVSVVGTFVMMLVISPILTGLIVLMLVVMFFVIKMVGKKSGMYFKRQQKSLGDVNGYIEEMIQGQKVVKVFCHEEASRNKFCELNENLRIAGTNAHTFASILMPIMGNLSYFNYAMTASVGAILMIRFGMLDLGSIASFLQYTRSFSQPITQMSQQFNSILSAIAGAERIFEVIDAEPETDDGTVSLTYAQETDAGLIESETRTGIWAWKRGSELIRICGDVRFHNVTFSYDGKKTVLNDVSFYAKPGQKIALVGSTGAGKTTITNLINRFYDIQEGTITYDGIDIKVIKKDDLRRSLSMVLQDTHLFTGTVMENIRYGRLDATDEEVRAAAKLANADTFIRHLPQGYDTELTSDGGNLSQGQRQLLAIARAAIADPPVLILDEATSSIDTRTERLIERGMDRLMEGRTVFVIAHRLSTVRNADAILVLEQGEIIERGDHDELIAAKGRYYQISSGSVELA